MSLASVAGTLKQAPSVPTRNLKVGARKTLEILQRWPTRHVGTHVAKSSILAEISPLRGRDANEVDICGMRKSLGSYSICSQISCRKSALSLSYFALSASTQRYSSSRLRNQEAGASIRYSWDAAGTRGRQQVLVGGSRFLWEAVEDGTGLIGIGS
jgi:hypothetical protein